MSERNGDAPPSAEEATRYQEVNRRGWAQLAQRGCEWTTPFGPEQFARAKELLDPQGWLPWDELHRVLCVGSGGGQQGPLFASLGRSTTVLDLSPEQLRRDEEVSRRHGLALELVQRDMLDMTPLHGRGFDLVYQAVSAVYVPDVRRLYGEVFQVLKPGGYYLVEHWSPLWVQMPEKGEWDGEAYRIIHPLRPGHPVPQTVWRVGQEDVPVTTWQFTHSMTDLIGGLCEAGFVIHRFAERATGNLSAAPTSREHIAAYIPEAFSILARKHPM